MSDERINAIVCDVGRRSLRLARPQFRTLELLAYLSKTLRLVDVGQSPCDYAVRIVVEVDGGRRVDVDIDGGVELLAEP
jgi:hypothetical protein